jgi:uncharacterized delta-60 repeat protein
MKQFRTTLISTLLITWLGSTAVVGCGDDDDGSDQPTAGKGGGTGSGGSAQGGGGTGGKGSGGGPVGGTGGSDGGVGGNDGGGVGGVGGAGGGTGETISKVSSEIFKAASDLRGLNFSQDGTKLYASGHIGSDPTTMDREIVVARFTPDGEPDPTFGTNGFVTLNLVERETSLQAAPPAGNGGAGGSDAGSAGSAGDGPGGSTGSAGDSGSGGTGGTGDAGGAGGSGGSGGATEVVINDGNEQSLGIVELKSGQLIVQANVRDATGKGQDVVLVKLDEDGELVTSFGTGGVKRIDFGWTPADTWTGTTGPTDDSWGIALDNTGTTEKIVVFAHGPAKAGSVTGNPPVARTDNDRYVARVLASTGALDPAFNGGAVYTVNTGGTFSDGGRRGIVLADGSIISSGYTNYGDGLGNHIVLLKLLPNGTPDPAFGFGISLPGVARTNPFLDDGGIAECYAVAQQTGGRLVTTGYGRATAAGGSSKYDFATTDAVDLVGAGILDDGLDTTFGRQGALAIQSEEANLGNTEDRGRDLIRLADDRVVFVGRFGPNPAIMVTTADGELDASFGEGGILAYEPFTPTGTATTSSTHFYRVALSPDGKRIAATTNNDAAGVLLTVLQVGD